MSRKMLYQKEDLFQNAKFHGWTPHGAAHCVPDPLFVEYVRSFSRINSSIVAPISKTPKGHKINHIQKHNSNHGPQIFDTEIHWSTHCAILDNSLG